jgi:hypothetical protein
VLDPETRFEEERDGCDTSLEYSEERDEANTREVSSVCLLFVIVYLHQNKKGFERIVFIDDFITSE